MVPLLGTVTLALREALAQAQSIVLEPVMSLEVRAPDDCLGPLMKDLGSRRAEIRNTDLQVGFAVVHGLVPLSEMFGYSTQMRSLTQGRASFSMEPFDYQPAKSWI
jgi:elongation factor G